MSFIFSFLANVLFPNRQDGKEDTTNVDEEFKSEPVKDTPAAPASKLQAKVVFPDFTYAAPSSLLSDNETNLGDK